MASPRRLRLAAVVVSWWMASLRGFGLKLMSVCGTGSGLLSVCGTGSGLHLSPRLRLSTSDVLGCFLPTDLRWFLPTRMRRTQLRRLQRFSRGLLSLSKGFDGLPWYPRGRLGHGRRVLGSIRGARGLA